MDPISMDAFLLRISLAFIFGGVIGLEREKHGRPAGFRTNILVCMGSTLVMMSSQQIYGLFQHLSGIQTVARVDPGRIASGIIMGIGFLGAGSIMRQDKFTRGLTTAACLWLITGVGIALGLGMYWWALATTALALLVLLPLKRLERVFNADHYSTVILSADAASIRHETVKAILDSARVRIQAYRLAMNNVRSEKSFVFELKYAGKINPEAITERLAALPGVKTVHWR